MRKLFAPGRRAHDGAARGRRDGARGGRLRRRGALRVLRRCRSAVARRPKEESARRRQLRSPVLTGRPSSLHERLRRRCRRRICRRARRPPAASTAASPTKASSGRRLRDRAGETALQAPAGIVAGRGGSLRRHAGGRRGGAPGAPGRRATRPSATASRRPKKAAPRAVPRRCGGRWGWPSGPATATSTSPPPKAASLTRLRVGGGDAARRRVPRLRGRLRLRPGAQELARPVPMRSPSPPTAAPPTPSPSRAPR